MQKNHDSPLNGVRYELEVLALDLETTPRGTEAMVVVLNTLKAWRGFVSLEFRWHLLPANSSVRFWAVATFDRAVPGTSGSFRSLMAHSFPSVEWGESRAFGTFEDWKHAGEVLRKEDLITFQDPQAEVIQFLGLTKEGELRLNRESQVFVHPWVNAWVPSGERPEDLIASLMAYGQEVVLSCLVTPTSPLPGEKNVWSMPLVPNRRPQNVRLDSWDAPRPELMGVLDQQLRRTFQTIAESWEGGLFVGRLFVFSPRPISATLLGRVGNHLTKPAGVPQVEYCQGGFSVRMWSEEESCHIVALWQSGQPVPFESDLSIPGKERLRYLFSPADAAHLLRVPQVHNQPFPGLRSRLFLRPEARFFPCDGIRLGTGRTLGQAVEVRQAESDRLRHTFIVGQTGTGKSSLLAQLILQDIEAGRGVGVVDPHGELIDFVLDRIPADRIDDVVLLDPLDTEFAVGLNPLETSSPQEMDFAVNALIDLFYALFTYETIGGPMFEMYLRNTLYVLMDQGNDRTAGLVDVLKFLQDPGTRRGWLEGCRNHLAVAFWEKEAGKAGGDLSLENLIPYITSKFGRFLYNHTLQKLFSQKHSTIDFREVLDGRKILLVDLRKGVLGEQAGQFLAMVLCGKLLSAAMSRTLDARKRTLPPFFLYVDELHLVADRSLIAAMSESRKYGLGLVAATQFAEQLRPEFLSAILGNVGTLVAFRMGLDDARRFEPAFHPVLRTLDFTEIENFQCYVKMLSRNVPVPGFHLTLEAPVVAPLLSHRDAIVESSRRRHAGTSAAEAEDDELARGEGSDTIEAELSRLFGG